MAEVDDITRVQVANLNPADSGRGIARLPDGLMRELGVSEGDVIEIVGKRATPTPMIASVLHYTTLNPNWNVPDDLVQSLIAPNVLKQGETYLTDRGYEVVLNWSPDAPRRCRSGRGRWARWRRT